MSVVIAIKYNEGVILASDRQASYGNLKTDNCRKIFKSKYSETAYGMAGSTRDIDILSCNIVDLMNYKDILDKVEMDKTYVVNNIVNNIFELLMDKNFTYKDAIELDGQYLIVSNQRIFQMFCNGAILEYENFCTIGSGCQLAKGLLEGVTNYDSLNWAEAIDLATDVVNKACKDDHSINNKMDIINLKRR